MSTSQRISRRFCRIGAAVVAVALFSVATSDAAIGYFSTGNDLYQECQSKSSQLKAACAGVIVGAYEMMEALGYECMGERVTREQVRDVVLKYLREHPEHRHEPAAVSIIMAMEAAFFCKPKN